jgi:hypothetical protein
MLMLASLIITPAGFTAESAQAFRQQNGLLAYAPPAWFLGGYFIARERNPGYVFGPVQDFVQAVSGRTTWLIEDLELKRLERASVDGKKPEYSLYLEAVERLLIITEKPKVSLNALLAKALRLKLSFAF